MTADERLLTVQFVVSGLAEALGRTIMANGFDPHPGAQVLREVAEQAPFLGRSKTPVMNAYSIALTRLMSALQHLSDLGRLLTGPATAFGPASLVRTTLENAAWAWWALDPSIGVKLRIARGLSSQIASLNEVTKFPFGRLQAEASTTRDAIAADAEAHGLFVQRSERDGTPIWVEEKPPRITRLLERQHGDLGTVIYRDLSAVAHGTLFAIMYRMKRADVPSGTKGFAIMEPSVPMDSLVLGSALALDSFWDATDRRFQLYGYEVSEWNGWVRDSRKRLVPILRAADPNSDG